MVLAEETLTVASFRDIWEADTSKKKSAAMDAFLFIYHMHHPKSPYSGYSDAERESAIRANELSNILRTSKRLQRAIDDFVRFRDEADPLFFLMRSAKSSIYKIGQYLNNADPESPDFSIKEVTDSLKKLGELIKSYNVVEEQVKEQNFNQTKTRGSREINDFEK